ncbi:MAG: zinc-ribbon domain-containing protein [Thermoplasmata archaeon]|jgi:magnesium-transporting ATPase (P-type)
MTKICPRCNTENPDNAVYCIKCGYKFGEEQDIQNKNEMINEPGKTTGIPIYIWVVLSLVFSIISFIAFLIWTLNPLFDIVMSASRGFFLINYNLIYFTILIIFLIGSIIVLNNVIKIYENFKGNNLDYIRKRLTIEFIVISFIFGLIITGVFLLLLQLDLESNIKKQ